MLLASKIECFPSNTKDSQFDPLPAEFWLFMHFKPPDFHTWVMLSPADPQIYPLVFERYMVNNAKFFVGKKNMNKSDKSQKSPKSAGYHR
jgi:hypothetical protein